MSEAASFYKENLMDMPILIKSRFTLADIVAFKVTQYSSLTYSVHFDMTASQERVIVSKGVFIANRFS